MGKPRERGHVAEGCVHLERVHALEIGHDISQSFYLDAGVKLLVEQDCHSFAERLIEFEFDANAAVFGESCMTARGTAVRCEIKDKHEDSFHKEVTVIWMPAFPWCIARPMKSLICHRLSLCTSSVQR
jgi:hypothetical protein